MFLFIPEAEYVVSTLTFQESSHKPVIKRPHLVDNITANTPVPDTVCPSVWSISVNNKRTNAGQPCPQFEAYTTLASSSGPV
ncbi:unnamed protein product [Protopolystoma xenopodis]|uniref:Uncharacterized protein n=1 Tax=Protopolystoma xenopodis TaxID=117903 RepID=A0A448XJ15_9PLAT|nr:unnamed protein product [Protopolystoma xenopodis]